MQKQDKSGENDKKKKLHVEKKKSVKKIKI